MRLGLLVRANNRGLGTQLWEIHRHLKPQVTVVIESLPDYPQWQFYPERYPDGIVTQWAGYTAPISDEAKRALFTCDVIFSVETQYDPTLFEEARKRGIATVLYVNPELWRDHETEYATAVWVPTAWRIDEIPRAERVTMPVALDRLADNQVGDQFLHLGGHKAKQDRNGMELAIRAARWAKIPLTVTTQDKMTIVAYGLIRGPTLDNYWEMYADHGVLVMPRKYGGLCLPVQEAMAAGLAVIMTKTSPNDDWPAALVPCQRNKRINLPGGQIDVYESTREAVGEEMKRMLDADYRGEFQQRGRDWAKSNSWDSLGPEWVARLSALC